MENKKINKYVEVFNLVEWLNYRKFINWENTAIKTNKQLIDEYFADYHLFSHSENNNNICNSDHISIDELLSEFKRQGFDTSNWDGEEGAEKAIVDGVRNWIEEYYKLR